jgi:hypothetical protein
MSNLLKWIEELYEQSQQKENRVDPPPSATLKFYTYKSCQSTPMFWHLETKTYIKEQIQMK